MAAFAPRSTRIHCGSLNALDQRVPGLPSNAADAGVPAFSVDEAVAGFPCDSRVVAAPAGSVVTTTAVPAASTRAAQTATVDRRSMMDASRGGAGPGSALSRDFHYFI